MTPVLSPEQRQAIEQAHGVPIQVVDPEENATYFLVPSAMFERLISTLDLSEPTRGRANRALAVFWSRCRLGRPRSRYL